MRNNRATNINVNIISIAIQLGLPLIVQYRKGSEALKILNEIIERSRVKVIGTIDFKNAKNLYELTGRYVYESNRKPIPKQDDSQSVTYVRASTDKLVAPEWLLASYRVSDGKALIINNLLSGTEESTKEGVKLLLGEADRFKMPKTLRVVGLTPKGDGGKLPSVYASTHCVRAEILGDEFLDISTKDEGMPIVLMNYISFLGKWRLAIAKAMRESDSVLRTSISLEEAVYRPVTTIHSWEMALKMLAAADSVYSSKKVMRASVESCVGELSDHDWNLIQEKYRESFVA